MTDQWLSLKSGSDIRGIAIPTKGRPATLTEAHGVSIGAAFIRWLKAKNPGKDKFTLAVGHDSRVTGGALARALIAGLRREPVRVLFCGLCTTPAMFMTTQLLGCDAAVMVTASHLPAERNGYKFITPAGGLEGADIEAVLRGAAAISPALLAADVPEPAPPVETVDFLGVYTGFLGNKLRARLGGDAPLSGLRIVVDAGNGAGGFYADWLATLGADTAGSQFLEPDGRFPNHIPNPEAPEAMRSVSEAVRRAGADLGVIFDADCDRAALVDADGRELSRNRLIALVSAILLSETPGITVVTDSVTSAGLEAFIEGLGGAQRRFRRGYKHVIDEAKRLCAEGIRCPLAMETSGHAAFEENYFLDDGMYLATRVIMEAVRARREGKALSDLIEGLREPVESVEIRLAITDRGAKPKTARKNPDAADFKAAGEAALSRVLQMAQNTPGYALFPNNYEGIRVACGGQDTWFLLRLSLHDPLLVLNAESDAPGQIAPILRALRAPLAEGGQIDLTALDQRLVPEPGLLQ